MNAHVASLWRYPVKGFTPERRDGADLPAGGYFPCDRLFAVENGPSGFDSAAPAHISKVKFTVLAALAEVARVHTAYDETTGELAARAAGQPSLRAKLTDPAGRAAFAAWLTAFLGSAVQGPLKVVHAPGHRFVDSRSGFVSVINLASVRDLESKVGRPIDPLRFRANFYVEGWPAWSEAEALGRTLKLGGATLEVIKPIDRCAATGVDPKTGDRDMDVVAALFEHFRNIDCGVYLRAIEDGRVAEGDAAAWL